MDEVDIDAEDFNELEARLYGQIHHEAVWSTASGPHISDGNEKQYETQLKQTKCVQRMVTDRSVINRLVSNCVPDTRYWVNRAAKPVFTDVINKTNQYAKNMQNNSVADPTSTNITLETNLPNWRRKRGNCRSYRTIRLKTRGSEGRKQCAKLGKAQQKANRGSENYLRDNMAAVASNWNTKLPKKTQKTQKQKDASRRGPFIKREAKLQKALLIKAKKQKSKNVRAKKHQQQKASVHIDNIIIDSSSHDENGANDTDDEDVILIPPKPPTTITLSDSDSDSDDINIDSLQVEQDNATDASDVMNSKNTTTNFTKPTTACLNVHMPEKHIEQIASRCTSPCSVVSSDDFIGQTDRRRLLEENCVADDEDLMLLTAYTDSLIQVPVSQINIKPSAAATNDSSDEVECIAEFTTPLATTSAAAAAAAKASKSDMQNATQEDYCVEQTEFRALDVYESESDIADSVYCKDAGRPTTIINAVQSSSEENDVQRRPVKQKVKRFSKRRTSTGNRCSEAHSTDEDEHDGVSKTGVSYIMRGSAVEHCKQKVPKLSQSLKSRQLSAGDGPFAGHIADTEFIVTLNSLLKGNVDDKQPAAEVNDDDNGTCGIRNDNDNSNSILVEAANAGEAFNIESDQESLLSVQEIETPQPTPFISEAVPDEVLAGLDKIFASIDNLGRQSKSKNCTEPEDTSDDDVEIIQPPVRVTSAIDKNNQYELPLHHIVYHEQNLQTGGIGWNEEMCKFYNSTWGSERFTLIGVQNSMEKDRKLWKISSEDRFPKIRPYSNLKCYNCCEFGHIRAKCTRPKKPSICYMCGESGHYEPRCPNTMCLRCGNKTQVFTKSCNACAFQNRLICPICKVRGHAINLCPDKWRRYHSTTQPNAHPNSQMVLNKRKMCCVCGGIGHFSETCRSAVRFMEYPIIVSQVKSHQKSYSDLVLKSQSTGIALNLLYKPGDTVIFNMAKKTAPNCYYGRFLMAVGLGYLIRRKRRSNSLTTSKNPPKQPRNTSMRYQLNPYGRAATEVANESDAIDQNTQTQSQFLQVPEVSGSINASTNVTQDATFTSVDTRADIDMEMDCTVNANNLAAVTVTPADGMGNSVNDPNDFKAPNEVPTSVETAPQLCQNKEQVTVDSDSNYSFSEHFTEQRPFTNDDIETVGISQEAELNARPSTSAAAKEVLLTKRVREMEALPDFIPLTSNSGLNTDNISDNFDPQTGISRRFVTADTDNESEYQPEQSDTPCEAKIYLAHFHSNYLLSPDGHEYLAQKFKAFNIKGRLDWTAVGHVLVIFGLPSDQDQFHHALLEKFRELMCQFSSKHFSVNKVPKRTDALIRFLRDNIIQLQSDLGDVNELHKRINHLEKTNTKGNIKQAEKYRRLLNMILLGQAGLCDGDRHLGQLLAKLKLLINSYQSESMVPPTLREEIDAHCRLIFTSYRHDNYSDLIQTYNRMPLKSRKPNLNIYSLVLGQKCLDTSLTHEQRARLGQQLPTAGFQPLTNKKTAENGLNSLNTGNSKLTNKQNGSSQPSTPQSSAKQAKQTGASIATPPTRDNNRTLNITPPQSNPTEVVSATSNGMTSAKKQTYITPPFINPQKQSTVVTKGDESAQSQQNALTTSLTGKATSKGPSIFWSREAMRYLDECIQLAESNAELLYKLQRIQMKSAEGALSYNDYRAVIKLHGAMVGN